MCSISKILTTVNSDDIVTEREEKPEVGSEYVDVE